MSPRQRIVAAAAILAIAAGIVAYWSTTTGGEMGRYAINPPKP
jgi:hypothetical protein